ncbi:hypothetical protein WJX77_000583 [Trebouxia sp. C0004]
MKQAATGSGLGSAADPSFPDTAAANADLEARLTGGNTGGAGNAMPNEAQKHSQENKHTQGSNRQGGQRPSLECTTRILSL